MNCKKLSLAIALGLFTIMAPARDAEAQWGANFVGAAEYDTDNTMLALAGISAGPRGLGWAPRIGVQGYFLRFDATDTRSVNVTAIRPYVGMRNAFNGGSAGINVGYAFVNRDVSISGGGLVPAFVEDHGDGVVLSGGWDYWGTGQSFGYQLLGSYNFGSDALWTRARGTVPLRTAATSQTRIGGEVAFLSGNEYSAWQPGVVLEFNNRSGRVFGLGAGVKLFEGDDDPPIYFKAEVSAPLFRR
jgi:hypothetical protein